MNRTLAVISLLGISLCGAASAEQSPWQIRARLAHINTANHSDPVGGAGASDRIDVSNKTILDLNASYFFTPHIAAELVLTNPQKHKVYLDGENIGTFKHLPPTLTLQYHFTPASRVSPYVGAGINYTRISDVKLLNGAGSLENDSFGLALQAGVDFKLDNHWSVNFDVKKIRIRSDVFVSGAKISRVEIDPYLIGIGVGYRF